MEYFLKKLLLTPHGTVLTITQFRKHSTCLNTTMKRSWVEFLLEKTELITNMNVRLPSSLWRTMWSKVHWKARWWNRAGLCLAPGHGSLSVSPVSLQRIDSSLHGPSLNSKGKIWTGANQGRERMQKQERGSQETILQPWVRVLVPPQGTHVTVSLSSSAKLKLPTNGRC